MAGYPYGGGQPYGYGGSPPTQPNPYGGAPPPSAPYASAGSDKPSKADKLQGGASASGYPSAPPSQPGYAGGYGGGGYAPAPPQSGGYAPAPPQASGYAPAPPQTGGYAPPQTGGYAPPQTGGYAPAPPQTGGYAPAQTGGYGGGYPPAGGYGSPFAALIPSAFPPGTDPNVVACFQAADADGSGFIDDKELQRALSSYNQSFSLRTVHLLMYLFTSSNVRKIGPKEFSSVFYSLQNWRSIFDRADRDRSGKIDTTELRDALLTLGFSVSPVVLDLLVSKFDKTGGKSKAIEYDNFIECCLTVKGLTEKFKEKDAAYSGSATFTYESFMLTVLPFLIA